MKPRERMDATNAPVPRTLPQSPPFMRLGAGMKAGVTVARSLNGAPTANTGSMAATVASLLPRTIVQASEAILLALLLLLPAAARQTPPERPAGRTTTQPAEELAQPDQSVVTHHRVTLADGQELRYAATVGFLPIREGSAKVQARMYYTAYVQEPSGDRRPITFAFNGGPGAASLWLHIGALGPKRVPLADDGQSLPKTIRLVDNPDTWLAFTDLVLIDPIGSGYSRVEPGIDGERFYGVEGDVHSVGEFIRLYVSRNQRWTAPKLMAGESYGTTRAAGLAKYLHREAGLDVDALILLSSALNFQTLTFARENDLPCVCYLPTYTAVAWYHHRLADDLQADLHEALEQAQRWAVDEYAVALAKGDELPETERDKIVQSLHRFTSLPESYIRQSNLRIPSYHFAKELLRDREQVVGILDGRVAAPALNPAGGSPEYDPSMFLVVGPFVAALQDYTATELGFRTDERYVFLSEAANQSWDWGSAVGGYVNVTDDLHAAMTENPNLRVFAGMGYFDLTAGYFAQQYMLSHLGLPPSRRINITQAVYPSGHQIYNHPASLKRLARDVAGFVRDTIGADKSATQSD